MSLEKGLLHTPVTTRTTLKIGFAGVRTLLARSIFGSSMLGSMTNTNQALDLSQFPLYRDVEDVVIAGNYDWGYHGDGESLIRALKQLRTHFKNGSAPSLGAALIAVRKNHGVNYGDETSKPMTRFVTCSDDDFLVFETKIRSEMATRQAKKEKRENQRLSDILNMHPLQYVVANAVGLTLGVQSHELGDLKQILGKKMSYDFSPKTPNTPNHHIGFIGTVRKIHCILSGQIIG